nr:MAG TPA: hypothetical protein [Caudoviricetes sp.]
MQRGLINHNGRGGAIHPAFITPWSYSTICVEVVDIRP